MKKDDDRKLYAFLSSFLTLIGFIIALLVRRDDKYVMFYAKQGLVLFIYGLIVSVIDKFTFSFISVPLWILWIALWVITWVNALSGEEKYTVLVKELAKKIRL